MNYPDVIYKTEKQKFLSVVDDIVYMNQLGRPVLVGTISIENQSMCHIYFQNAVSSIMS